MGKIKTKNIIVKRFKVTKNGKVLRRKAFARHLNVKKSGSRRRRLSRVVLTNKIYARKIKKVLGTKKH